MRGVGRPRVPVEVQREFWVLRRRGMGVEDAAVVVGVSAQTGWRWVKDRGGVLPDVDAGARTRVLTFGEREEIAVLHAQRIGVREIARRIGRSPSTVSRELRRLPPTAQDRASGKQGYRASVAQAHADARARRPKPAKLATNLRLRTEVQTRLRQNQSPEQISARLRIEFPNEPEMWVSSETIYQALYVQSRGALKKELIKHLRTGRSVRKTRGQGQQRRSRIPDMVNISERPAEVADRAVPGHWEGDLILGSTESASAIGTLVERSTRFTMLLHLPGDHTAATVSQAMLAKIPELPELMWRSLTWDQGSEMARHKAITQATGLAIYFCDPHSPWQRGTNENTNGLLRQYFPKGTDLSFYGPGYLDKVAAELNARPRKTLNWRTPAEVMNTLLSGPNNQPVATTG